MPELAKAAFMKGKSKLVGVEFGDMIEVLFEQRQVEGRVLTIDELRPKARPDYVVFRR